jgi:predicted DNA-binding transcriptional regulator YafY
MNRTDRLVAMVMHMQGRRLVRAEDMAAHFEVSVRTIYRDISALGEAGVPITGEAGVGYSLVRSYHLPPVMLTTDEAAALFVGAEMVRHFTDASMSAPMTAALDKLRAVLPPDRKEHIERLARQTVVMGRMCNGNGAHDPAAQPWLLAVQRGVAGRRVLRLTYRGAGKTEATAREVEPLGVVFHSGAWYLVAWCRLRKDLRHFRVDRVQQLEMLPEMFPARTEFSLARHLDAQMSKTDTVPARVWFADGVQERAKKESYATLVEELRRDGGAEFSLYTYSLAWMARWILSFGAEAEALEPLELREMVRATAVATAARYGAAVGDEVAVGVER